MTPSRLGARLAYFRHHLGCAPVLFVLAGLLVVPGAAFLYSSARNNREQQAEEYEAFASRGVAVTGVMDRKSMRTEHRQTGPRNMRKAVHIYTIHYHFVDADGQTHHGQGDVGESLYNQFQRGAKVPVQYVRDKPNLHRLNYVPHPGPSMAGEYVALTFGCLFAILGVVGCFACAIAWKQAGRDAALICDGQLYSGEVIEISSEQVGKTTTHKLVYAFTDSQGLERTGESDTLIPRLVGTWEAGQAITIAQDPNNPDRILPDLFRLHSA